MIVAGCDPHIRKLAFSLIEYTPDAGRRHIKTCFYKIPDLKDKAGNLKKTAVVSHRLRRIFLISYRWLHENAPDAFGIEAFKPMPKTGKDTLMKMSGAITAVRCAAFALDKIPMEYYADETRRLILGRAKGTKEEVWNETFSRYPELRFPEVAASEMEHLHDSLAVAEDTLLEIMEDSRMRGGLFDE